MTTYPRVAFVSGPDVGATVRLDLNDAIGGAGCQVNADDFTLGAPSLDGDPTAVGQVWGYRSITLTPRLTGAKAAALAALSAISRQQLRAENWLLFQLDASTDPVWFKTYRSSPQPVSLEEVDAAGVRTDAWQTTLTLTADSHAYGARETLSTVQVVQAPADLTSPTRYAMRYVLPAVKGDAPTRLRVTISPSTPSDSVQSMAWSWLVGCIAGSASMTDTVVDIGTGDSVANVNGTASPTTNAAYFGGSYRAITIPSSSPNNLDYRFTITLPNTVQVGRYRVLMRVKPAAANKTLLFRAVPWPDGNSVAAYGPTTQVDVSTADTNRALWVDMGEFSFPFGLNPPSDAGGTIPSPMLGIQVGTGDSSSASVNVDSVKLIPIAGPSVTEATLLRSKVGANLIAYTTMTSPNLTFDGDLETCWAKTSAGVYVEAATVALAGSFPAADPAAAQNLLLLMALDSGPGSATGTNYVNALNAQAAIDISYHPRYLHIGDGT